MSQLKATFMKTAKFFVRNRALLLGIVIWPLVLTVIMASTELAALSASVRPLGLGALTISMAVFALMLACIMSLPGSIARDREIGLIIKLRSMPIKPEIDTLGRLLAYLIFAFVIAGLVTLVGLGLGAQFPSASTLAVIESVGFLLIAVIAAAGIGLILGSFIKSVMATAFIGLAVVLAFSFVSGILVPYSDLSAPLQTFSRVFPVSSATSSISYLLLGQDVAGYNPIAIGQVMTTSILAFVLLIMGLFIYHRTSWHQDSSTSKPQPKGFRRLQQRIETGA